MRLKTKKSLTKMKATTDFVPQEILDSYTGPYIVFTKLGWGQGKWYVIRRSDRKVMTSSDRPFKCLHWIRNYG